MMFCEMEPPVSQSIRQIHSNIWVFGSSIVCEQLEVLRDDVLASWRDDSGRLFCLYSDKDATTSHHTVPVDDATATCSPFHTGGTSAAVWKIGGAFCKVKAWVQGMETEADALRYVKERFRSSIPVPDILYDWVEPDTNRSFLVLKVIDGKTAQQAWPDLSTTQREQVADQVAQYCGILAREMSDLMQTSTGCGIREPFLLQDSPPEAPSWRPVLLDPLSRTEASDYLRPMDVGQKFHFGNADLSPTNIIVADDGQVRGILDWESAAFYPRDWIATKARIAYGFILEDVDPEHVWDWRDLFVSALVKRRFKVDLEAFRLFNKKIKNK